MRAAFRAIGNIVIHQSMIWTRSQIYIVDYKPAKKKKQLSHKEFHYLMYVFH